MSSDESDNLDGSPHMTALGALWIDGASAMALATVEPDVATRWDF